MTPAQAVIAETLYSGRTVIDAIHNLEYCVVRLEQMHAAMDAARADKAIAFFADRLEDEIGELKDWVHEAHKIASRAAA